MSDFTRPFSRRAFVGGAAVLGISLSLPALSPSPALAVTAAEKQAEAAAALEKLNAMQEKLDQTSDNYFIAKREQEEAQGRMDEAQGRIDEASSRISELQDHLGSRARSMYRSGSSSFLDLLLGATSFQAFASNWDLLNDMNQDDADMVAETKTLREQVEAEKATYEEQRNIAEEKKQAAEAAKAEAEVLVAQTQEIYDSLSAEAAQLLAEEEAAREAAAREAARRAEEEARRQAEEEERQRQQEEQRRQNSSSSSNSSSDSGSKKNSSSSSSNDSKAQTVTGNTVVDRAYSQLGKPYIWGAAGPDGFDCSGLVGYCLTGKMGNHWCDTGTIQGWTRVSNPKPGDICIRPGHTGVYIGDGQMIHAPHTGDVVKIASVKSNMWYVRY